MIGGANPPDERKEGMPMDITYQDLIQIRIFIVRHLLFGVGRVFLAFLFLFKKKKKKKTAVWN